MARLYLDDIRSIPIGWHGARTIEDFKAHFEEYGCPEEVSFDHDLSIKATMGDWEQEITGYECAKWMLEAGHRPKKCYVHSMNPVGKKRIELLLKDYGY